MLELIKNWRVDNESSADNIILQHKIVRTRSKDDEKEGKYKKGDKYEVWTDEGYYVTITSCLNTFIKSKAIMGLTDWDEVVSVLKRIELKINEIFEPKYIRGVKSK